MKQTDLGLDLSTRRTRKQILLDEMEQVMLWAELLALVAPHAPVAKTGRPPFDLEMSGLAKNTAQLITLFALSNIWMARKVLMQRAQA